MFVTLSCECQCMITSTSKYDPQRLKRLICKMLNKTPFFGAIHNYQCQFNVSKHCVNGTTAMSCFYSSLNTFRQIWLVRHRNQKNRRIPNKKCQEGKSYKLFNLVKEIATEAYCTHLQNPNTNVFPKKIKKEQINHKSAKPRRWPFYKS